MYCLFLPFLFYSKSDCHTQIEWNCQVMAGLGFRYTTISSMKKTWTLKSCPYMLIQIVILNWRDSCDIVSLFNSKLYVYSQKKEVRKYNFCTYFRLVLMCCESWFEAVISTWDRKIYSCVLISPVKWNLCLHHHRYTCCLTPASSMRVCQNNWVVDYTRSS